MTRDRWSRTFVRTLVASDVLGAGFGVAVGVTLMAGAEHSAASLSAAGAAIVLTWLAALQASGCYEARRVTDGAEEFRRVLRATWMTVCLVAVVAYFAEASLPRGFLAFAIAVGLVAVFFMRTCVRRFAHAQRETGAWRINVLAVGSTHSVKDLIDLANRAPWTGLTVVGACINGPAPGTEIASGVQVVADVHGAAQAAADLGVDVVAVSGAGQGSRWVRELGWQLEGSGRDLVMAPELTDVAGPRLHVRPVSGLPLLWVDQPRFTGATRVIKRLVDIVGASFFLLVGAPIMLIAAIAIKVTSRGPIFYYQMRSGMDGKEFKFWKFRSMVADAEARHAELMDQNEKDGGILFKMKRDPRITPVGRILRKFSIDELPQLLNVIGGSMSLVGPRPWPTHLIEKYSDDVRRRLLVKPGITGMWQVGGRSDLDWEESVRLDLYYVENWSLAMDMALIARTMWAVVRCRGAY